MAQPTEPAETVVASVRRLVEERDALAARVSELEGRCQAQEAVLARAHELMTALDDYAREHGKPEAPAAQPAAPEPTGGGTRAHARRYSEAHGREWLAELRAGKTAGDLYRERGIGPDTVQRWVKAVLPGAVFDRGRLVEPEPSQAVDGEQTYPPGFLARFTDVQAMEAARRMREGLSPEEAAEAFGVDVERLQGALRTMDIDPDTGHFLNRPPLEDLLQEPETARANAY